MHLIRNEKLHQRDSRQRGHHSLQSSGLAGHVLHFLRGRAFCLHAGAEVSVRTVDRGISILDDPDLASLQGDPEFEAIVEELRRRNE
jgi:hypothetical protein